MKNPLRSKDLDLLSSQMGPNLQRELAQELSRTPGVELRNSTVQTRPLNGRNMTTYSVEVRVDRMPFFVEVFDTVLNGRSPSLLNREVQRERRWGLEIWAPSPNAVVGLRLAFRRPEGMTRLNATRLNSFIKENRRRLDFREIARLIHSWDVADLVHANLIDLYYRHSMRIIKSEKIFPSIRAELTKKKASVTS